MDLAAIGADAAAAKALVLGGDRLHLGNRAGAIGLQRRHAHLLGGLQVVQYRRIIAGMHHRRAAAWHTGNELVGKRAAALIQIPIKALGQRQALAHVQPQRMHIGQEHQQAGHPHLDAEFLDLLDGVDGVRTGIGQAQHLGAGCLRLDQEGREIGRAGERGANRADHLAAGGLDELADIALQRMAEGIVGGDKKPAIAAGLDHGAAGRLGQHIGVVDPVQRIGVARLARQVGTGRTGGDHRLVLVAPHIRDGQGDRGIRQIDHQVDAVAVVPLARHAHADIGLVLVVGGHDLNLDRRVGGHELGGGDVGGGDRAGAGDVLVRPGHVGQHADLDGARLGAGRGEGKGGNGPDSGRGAKQRTTRKAHEVKVSLEVAVADCGVRFACWTARQRNGGRDPGYTPR